MLTSAGAGVLRIPRCSQQWLGAGWTCPQGNICSLTLCWAPTCLKGLFKSTPAKLWVQVQEVPHWGEKAQERRGCLCPSYLLPGLICSAYSPPFLFYPSLLPTALHPLLCCLVQLLPTLAGAAPDLAPAGQHRPSCWCSLLMQCHKSTLRHVGDTLCCHCGCCAVIAGK